MRTSTIPRLAFWVILGACHTDPANLDDPPIDGTLR